MRKIKALFIIFIMMSIQGMAVASTGRKILHIGDSHTNSVFGKNLYDDLSEKHEISSYGLCGATPNTWIEPSPLRSSCVGEKTFTTRSNASSTMPQENITSDAFSKLLDHHKPDTVVISLGDQMNIDEVVNVEAVIEEVSLMLQSLPEEGGVDCFWVTPTFGDESKNKIKSAENLASLINSIEAGIEKSGKKCTVIRGDDDSLKEGFREEFTLGDGVHLKNDEAKLWGEYIAEKINAQIGVDGDTIVSGCETALEEALPGAGEVAGLTETVEEIVTEIEEEVGAPIIATGGESIIGGPKDYAYAPAYAYNEPTPSVQKSSNKGFFGSLFSGIANIFKAILNGISSVFSGIFGFFSQPFKPVSLTSTDPLERNSDLLGTEDLSLSDEDAARMAADGRVISYDVDREEGGIGGSVTLSETRYDVGGGVPRTEESVRARTGSGSGVSVPSSTINPATITYDTDLETTEESEILLRQEGRVVSERDNYADLAKVARDAYHSGGRSACVAALNKAYDEISPAPIWKDLSIDERARKIREHAEYTFKEIKETSTEERPSNSNYKNMTTPHYIHPALSKSVGMCIPFIETRGTLNPHALNYTYCLSDEENSSTAHGLGQQTKKTFSDLRDQKALPLTVAKEYDSSSNTEIFHHLNNDVTLQMEVIYRYMNYEIKRMERSSMTDDEKLFAGVAAYDQDQQSEYLDMFKKCHYCVQALPSDGDVATCYREMK